jgi:hypothetical protein
MKKTLIAAAVVVGIPSLILIGWIAIIYLSALANKGWFG